VARPSRRLSFGRPAHTAEGETAPWTAGRMLTLRKLLGFARIDGLALFDKGLHPAEHSNPSVAVALRLREVADESFMPYFHERARADLVRPPGLQAVNLAALQLPAHYRCHRRRVACNPG